MAKSSSYTTSYTEQPEIKSIIDYLGIPTTDNDPQYGFQYDGNAISIKNISVSALLHEISHWLLASETERKLIDYGLGRGPDTGRKNPDAQNKADEVKIKIESLILSKDTMHLTNDSYASLLGIAFEAALGYDISKTTMVHNWASEDCKKSDDMFDKFFFSIISSLQDKKLLTGHIPTILAKQGN